MAGRETDAGARDQVEDLPRRWHEPARRVEDADPAGRGPRLRPTLHRLAEVASAEVVDVVLGRERRHPDHPGAELDGVIDRGRVEPTRVVVQDDAAVGLDAGHLAADQRGPAGRVLLVSLEEDTPHAPRPRLRRQPDVVRDPLEEARRGVLVQVDRALKQFVTEPHGRRPAQRETE